MLIDKFKAEISRLSDKDLRAVDKLRRNFQQAASCGRCTCVGSAMAVTIIESDDLNTEC